MFQGQNIEDVKVAGKKGQPNYMVLKANNVCTRAQAHSAAFFFFFGRDQVSKDRNVVMFTILMVLSLLTSLKNDLPKFAMPPEPPASLTTCPSKKLQ